MPGEFEGNRSRRRYARVKGPFGGRHLGRHKTHVLVYDLNLGGAVVNFTDGPPQASTLMLKINLPHEGPITVNAEPLYRHDAGVAVRFLDVDSHTAARLRRTVDALKARRHAYSLGASS